MCFDTCMTKLAPESVWSQLYLSSNDVVICFKRKSCDSMVSVRNGSLVNNDNERWEGIFKEIAKEIRRENTTYSTIDTSVSGTGPRKCFETLKELQQKRARESVSMHILSVVRVDHIRNAHENSGVRVRWYNFNASYSQESIKNELKSFLLAR